MVSCELYDGDFGMFRVVGFIMKNGILVINLWNIVLLEHDSFLAIIVTITQSGSSWSTVNKIPKVFTG